MPVKSTAQEEEYIKRQEIERIKKAEEEKHKNFSKSEKKRMQELHFMKCPKCGMELFEVEFKGIKVDKCSDCDGIWFDAGEFESVAQLNKSSLDKLFGVFKK
ncbi:MAG TPA: zf-TFIIB domain-containing protein [Dissulfurispiraceae bacterium]|nr:zf-TFIIB domain-containing protein [Dissulfurispiraceae bacterium]